MPRTVPRGVATALAVVAAVSIVGIVTTWWAHRYPLDSDRFTDAAVEVLDDPEVVAAVSLFATDQTVDLVFVVADPRQFLPGPLGDLGAGPERWVRDRIAAQMERVVRTETVQGWLTSAIRETHGEVVAVIQHGESQSGLLTYEDQIVRLDLTGVMAGGLDVLADQRFAPGSLRGMQDSMRGGLDGFRLWVVDNVGLDIGEHLGTVVVYDASEVGEGGLALRTARWVAGSPTTSMALWFALLIASAVALVVLAPDPDHSLVVFGGAVAGAAVLVYLYVWRIAIDIEHLIEHPALAGAAADIASQLMRPLLLATLVLVVAGLAAAAAPTIRARTRPVT